MATGPGTSTSLIIVRFLEAMFYKVRFSQKFWLYEVLENPVQGILGAVRISIQSVIWAVFTHPLVSLWSKPKVTGLFSSQTLNQEHILYLSPSHEGGLQNDDWGRTLRQLVLYRFSVLPHICHAIFVPMSIYHKESERRSVLNRMCTRYVDHGSRRRELISGTHLWPRPETYDKSLKDIAIDAVICSLCLFLFGRRR